MDALAVSADIQACQPSSRLAARLAARGRSRAEPRSHDLVRERGARRKSMLAIADDEQRSYRAKSLD
jgi:hypothetical protein